MIEEKDTDVLLNAKKDSFAIDILTGLSAISLGVLVFLEGANMSPEYTIPLAVICLVLCATAFGKNRWVSVSRNDLVSVIERVVNSDPEALRILANKNKA